MNEKASRVVFFIGSVAHLNEVIEAVKPTCDSSLIDFADDSSSRMVTKKKSKH